ncbi:hypothetical protein [Deinococcus sp. PESE-13]
MTPEQAVPAPWRPGESVLLLSSAGLPLGHLIVLELRPFAFRCAFEPLPAYETYRALFEEDNRLAEGLAHDRSPGAFARAEAVQAEVQGLGLVLRREGGRLCRDFLLGIDLLGVGGPSADLRPLTPVSVSPLEEPA